MIFNHIKMILNSVQIILNRIFEIIFLKTVVRQKLINNDAGEARDPSRKMRLEKSCKQRP